MSLRDKAIAGTVIVLGAFTMRSLHADAGVHAAHAHGGHGLGHRRELVIAYVEAQEGKPYLWGGTGPDSFDCSGLAMQGFASAGITIPRTSQDQFTEGRQIPASEVRPGDEVFFAGSDGTPDAPGHVGIVLGRKWMVEAYATGFAIRKSEYGTPQSAPGDRVVVGYTDPYGAP